MEHSVVTKGSPGCQTGAEEIPASFHETQSFFHENHASGIHFQRSDEMSPSITSFERIRVAPLTAISPVELGSRMFQYEEFRYHS
jgi:hypothetical protein